ncbi:MAG TPA: methyl-accepting chemotaxis protein [Stellaceae bacterium]|nr:methyl-accepting chemotaxis protein [Stellaceae bacterium]
MSLRNRRFELRAKLMLQLALAVVLPAAAFLGVVLVERGALESPAGKSLSDQAAQLSDVVDRTLFQRYGDARAMALNPALPTLMEEAGKPHNPIAKVIDGYMPVYRVYRLMMLLSAEGKVLAVNGVDSSGKEISTEFFYRKDLSRMSWFRDALDGRLLNGRDGLGTVAVRKANVDQVQLVYGDDGEVVVFAAPVRDESGKTIAVWANFFDSAVVEGILAAAHDRLVANGLLHARISVLNRDGDIIFDSRARASGGGRPHFAEMSEPNLLADKVPAAVAALEGKQGWLVAPDRDTHAPEVSGYAPSLGAYDYPGLGWVTLVHAPADEAFGAVHAVVTHMLIAAVVIALIALALGAISGTLFVRPIRRITAAMTRAADGESDVHIPALKRRDEIGDMARALQILNEHGKEVVRLEAEKAEQEQRAAIERQRAVTELADQFERDVGGVVAALSTAAAQMEENAQRTARSIAEAGEQASAAAAAAQQVSGGVQTVAGAAEELASSCTSVGEQVQRSHAVARSAAERARSTDVTVQGLAAAAHKIGEVVKLINDIASQTNLLALNATIEAARAGDAGKGFAVVASEVKSLATQTAKATDDIGAQISAMQQATAQAVAAIRDIASTISDINGIAEAIAAAVQRQQSATQEIAENVQQAASGTEAASGSIGTVSRAAIAVSDTAEEMLAAAKELRQRSAALSDAVDGFLGRLRAA